MKIIYFVPLLDCAGHFVLQPQLHPAQPPLLLSQTIFVMIAVTTAMIIKAMMAVPRFCVMKLNMVCSFLKLL